jgi:predicted nuclease of predicted toxin-antitoxin system
MPEFLIDVNLPYHSSLWKGDNCIHQKDIDDEWTDTQIWNYARENDRAGSKNRSPQGLVLVRIS